ncbi:hypothetical protein KJ980_00155 [Patescibacteria group bacterium]|nr:hypothetical protein [Patescibacteria group bacterium]MBU4016531.1 hypothetical protein [Patescibacteria group bacterium]MBU4098040.1 hypothetical protein [Patescibacteria group bacterium]
MNKNFVVNDNQEILVFKAREIEKLELDSENDFRDEISSRINNDNFIELYSGWDYKNKYYIVVVQI